MGCRVGRRAVQALGMPSATAHRCALCISGRGQACGGILSIGWEVGCQRKARRDGGCKGGQEGLQTVCCGCLPSHLPQAVARHDCPIPVVPFQLHREGEDARPNCHMETYLWVTHERGQPLYVPLVALVTNRQVEAGEELTISYGEDYWAATLRNMETFARAQEERDASLVGRARG